MDQKTKGCGCQSTEKPTITDCCSGVAAKNSGCCASGEHPEKRLLIDFMYIDLTVCERCTGTDASLEETIAEVAKVLKATGYEIEVRKTLIESEEQACELGFISSPTIRINGHDIQLDVKESLCESCGDVCGEEVDCRVWVWQGQEYTTPPKAMIVNAILRYVYGDQQGAQQETKAVPDNLKKFFAAKNKKCC
ncbi:hypothetical protein SPSIL_029210 [Sporomusa silvacetica DSM 10669]|uniref:Ferredoxin n=1 Tax=Sporomusa silvacetica DSM 10669 TaxID=1123289 RepID=A0ABZ3IM39_9FIRM|nr:DUF2703 domain-containing protein [Sporomusa silvacetica]OZC15729.1 hypothetical protein SPSIL_40590 [Sporomusa silvacetica DSM 10669]